MIRSILQQLREDKKAKQSRNYFPSLHVESGLTLCFFELSPGDKAKEKAYDGVPVPEALETRHFPFLEGANVSLTEKSGYGIFDPELGPKLALWGKLLGQPAVRGFTLINHIGFNPDASSVNLGFSKGRNPTI